MNYRILAIVLPTLALVLLVFRPQSRTYREFEYNQNGASLRARVIEGRLLSIEIEESGDWVYFCQTRAAFNWLNGYNAQWLGPNLFLLDTGDIGRVEFERGTDGTWRAKNSQEIHVEGTLK